MDSIFLACFVAIAQIISFLESFKDEKGVNISNWITKLSE